MGSNAGDTTFQRDRVLFYIPVGNGSPLSRKLFQVIEELRLEKRSEICRTIRELTGKLRYPEERPRVGVIMAPNRKDLSDVLSIRELLHTLRVLLILPDSEYETVSLGHTLRPRFLTDKRSSFADLVEVLRKMGNAGAPKPDPSA